MESWRMNRTMPNDFFARAIIRLGFIPAEEGGRKLVQLSLFSPEQNDSFLFRVPYVSDESERITLLAHDATFFGGIDGSKPVPDEIREAGLRKLAELCGDELVPLSGWPEEEADEYAATGENPEEEEEESRPLNGVMAPEEADLVRLGKEMKMMKTNSELEREGLIPDPIQN
jgi:hypothetical protein